MINNLPASVQRRVSQSTNEVVGNSPGGGFPVVSIKGKVFHVQRGDERTLVTKPGEDDPASSIEVVVVRANPNRSKVFYAEGYQEGDRAKPTCYSNDGVAPAADAAEPQSKKCAACPHNERGSRITSDGRKAKACADSRRLAIATVDTPADPMMIRVPAASMKALEEYGKMLAARGIAPHTVVTKIGFDYSVAHPQLTFRPVGLIADEAQLQEIEKVRESDIVSQIIGLAPTPPSDAPGEETPLPPIVPPVTAAPAAPKAAKPKAAAVDAAVAAADGVARSKVKAEDTPAPAPATKPAASVALEGQLKGLLDDMDFDD